MSRPLLNVGVPDAPSDSFSQWVRNTLLSLQANLIDAAPVTNMRATALAGAIQIDFTRSDGDAYTLYKNTTATTDGSTRIDLGASNLYVDNIGDDGVKRYYMVVSKIGGRDGGRSPWVSATTLTLDTPVTPPVPPPPAEIAFTNQETESVSVSVPTTPGSYEEI